MVWAYVLAQSPAMGNPFEFRETMKAAFGYSDKTVEQLRQERSKKSPKSAGKGATPARAPSGGTPRPSELAKLQALLAGAKPHPAPPKG